MMPHDYTELMMTPEEDREVSNDCLGAIIRILLVTYPDKPVIVRIADNPEGAKPWAADNEGNWNRRGIGK